MIDILLGFIVGAVQVGAVTWRMVQVIQGNMLRVLAASAVVSLAYYFGVYFIIDDNLGAYIGFSLGAAAATCVIAYRNRLQIEEKDG